MPLPQGHYLHSYVYQWLKLKQWLKIKKGHDSEHLYEYHMKNEGPVRA